MSLWPFLLYLFHRFSWQHPAFSLCSSGLISALLVLSTIYLLMKVSLSPDTILCGWLGSKHQVTALPAPSPSLCLHDRILFHLSHFVLGGKKRKPAVFSLASGHAAYQCFLSRRFDLSVISASPGRAGSENPFKYRSSPRSDRRPGLLLHHPAMSSFDWWKIVVKFYEGIWQKTVTTYFMSLQLLSFAVSWQSCPGVVFDVEVGLLWSKDFWSQMMVWF